MQTLNLSVNQLTELPSGIFNSLTSLTTLSLSDNQLTASMVPAGIFNSLSALGSLDLSLNQLTELPAGIFNSLTNLTTLDLCDNQLTASMVPAGIFNSLTNLTTLGLCDNQLTELPAGIFSGLEMLTGVTVAGNATNPLPLTVTIQETGSGMAVIEVAAGVPFTSVTATLSITGGTFSGENATTSVTLSTGQTRSSPFAFTVDEPTMTTPVPEAMIRITDTASDPTNILTGFTDPTGYSGFTLASGPALTRQMGICDRTMAVQTAILTRIGGGITCTMVTAAQLAGITGTLPLSGQSLATLMSDDFDGLSGLEILNLSDNMLESLPEGVFSELSALTSLDVSDNMLESLLEGVFSDLMALQTLRLNGNRLTMLPEGVFAGLTSLMGVDVSGNNTADGRLTFAFNLEKTEEGGDSFVVKVAQGAPTDLTVNITVEGGTVMDMNDDTITEIMIPTGMTESAVITVEPDSGAMEVTVTLMNATTITPFNNGIGYSGFNFTIVASDEDSTFIFEALERLERVGESILPAVSRELISGVQNIVSARIGRLTTNPVIGQPTAQVAGQSTLSDLLTFTAQTFDRVHNQDQSFAMETLLQETSFALSVNGEEETSRTGLQSIAVWGSADYQNVSGGDTVSWDGSIISLHIGSDIKVTDEVLGGVSVSWSQGMFDYKDSTMRRSQEGEYEVDLWSVHPYGGWMPLPWLNLWVVGGYGFGEVTIKDEGITGSQSSDVQSYSGSFGASAERAFEENSILPGVTTVRVKAQTSVAMMEVEDNGEMISSLMTEAYQQRVSVEASHICIVCEERYFIPTLEIGLRNDGGDGETGNGLEIGGDVEYRATDLGLRVLVNGRWLALHSGELEEWGIGGSIRFEPEARAGQGFWMSVTPEWGEMGSRELWDAKIEDVERVSEEREARVSGEVGYGARIGKTLLTPSVGVSLTNEGYRSYRVGSGVVVGQFSLTLEGERRSMGSASLEESVMLQGSLRF